VVLALCAVVGAEEKAKAPTQVTGAITAVDAAAKAITVKGMRTEVKMSITEKTKITKLVPVKAADIAEKQMVRVGGKVAKDKKSIEARMITILPEGEKPRGKGLSAEGALGTVTKAGESLTLKTVDGEEITVTLTKEPKPTLVAKPAAGAFADLKEGINVRVETAAAEGEGVRATRVTILLPGMGGGKAKGKAKAG
jgi:hypothetical protein